MSGVLTASRLWRYGSQLVAGIAIGLALGVAVREARAEDAASLLASPKRLEMVQAGCKTNQPWATESLCREAAQAIRLRFHGPGVRYTPQRVEPYPSRPATKHPTPASPPGQARGAGAAVHDAPHPASGRP